MEKRDRLSFSIHHIYLIRSLQEGCAVHVAEVGCPARGAVLALRAWGVQ